MFEPGIAMVERDAAVQSLIDLHFGSGETVAAGLRMDLQALAVPLHDIVVADDALVGEAADAFQILRRGAPGFFDLTRRAGEAAIVIGDEAGQHGVSRIEIASMGQAKFAGKTVLEDAPEALDAAFGLGSLRGDEGDAELSESAAELSGLAPAGKLFVDRPVVVIAGEDAAAITVEGDGNTIATQEALEKVEIALGGFRGEEPSGEDFAGGIILHSQGGEQRAAAFEPVVRGAVELHELALASRTQTALTMSGRTALARRADAVGTEQSAQGFAAEREAFVLDEFVVKMMIVEACIAGACQSEDAFAGGFRRASVAGAAAADVSQSRCAAQPIARFKPFDLPGR